jgi:hypothetical protein
MFKHTEKILGVTWLIVAVLVLFFAIAQFTAGHLDARSFSILLVGGGLLVIMGSLITMKLRGRKIFALAMSLILGFREYMLWVHGLPETIDLWVLRSIVILLLAVATFVFYLLVRLDEQAPKTV